MGGTYSMRNDFINKMDGNNILKQHFKNGTASGIMNYTKTGRVVISR